MLYQVLASIADEKNIKSYTKTKTIKLKHQVQLRMKIFNYQKDHILYQIFREKHGAVTDILLK